MARRRTDFKWAQDLAQDLLYGAGQPATLERQPASWDRRGGGVASTVSISSLYRKPYDEMGRDDESSARIGVTEGYAVCPAQDGSGAEVEPQEGDFLTVGGERFTVKKVRTQNPNGQRIYVVMGLCR